MMTVIPESATPNSDSTIATNHRFGFIALAGRPNVGKSTLVNQLVGEKVSITSRRPQTTRHRILGIRDDADSQLILVDTPGIHQAGKQPLNRRINQTAMASLAGVDAILMIITAPDWHDGDNQVLKKVAQAHSPMVLAINKIDLFTRPEEVLPLIDRIQTRCDFTAIVPISALKGTNLDRLLEVLKQQLPYEAPGFPKGQLTDRDQGFMAAELIREQIFRQIGEEVPYLSAVKLESFSQSDDGLIRVGATIWVGKMGHKGILIGKGGSRLKMIGQAAREQMQQKWGKKVYLDLWVKVKSGWNENQAMLHSLGLTDE